MFNPLETITNSKHFKLTENWGDPNLIYPPLIRIGDDYRDALEHPLFVSPARGAVYAEGTGHSDASWHYIIPGRNDYAMAMDTFPKGDLFRAWLIALKFPYTGIGLYPYWEWPAKNLKGGLHLDVRYLEMNQPRALWWCDRVWDEKKRKWIPVYRSLTKQNDIDAMLVAMTLPWLDLDNKVREIIGKENR